MSELIEVRSSELGVWFVLADDRQDALSSHASESEAELAAQAHALAHGGRVVVHDRYGRVHECPRPPGAIWRGVLEPADRRGVRGRG